MKRRVEAESWEKEAREKDLSLAEVKYIFFSSSLAEVGTEQLSNATFAVKCDI